MLFSFKEPNVWTAFAQSSRPIVLYGMGNAADRVLDEFEKRNIKAAGVMASDDFCRYQQFRGYTVMKQSDFEKIYGHPAAPQTAFHSLSPHRHPCPAAAPFTKGSLCIALCFGSSLPDVMSHIYRVAEEHELYVPNIPVTGNVLMDDSFIEKYRGEIQGAYDLLADELSRRVYKGALDFYYTGRLKYLKEIETDKEEAFRDILRLNGERYLDLGAYRGDTVDEFLHYTDGYESILAVEPNPKNYAKLCEHIEGIENARALNVGTADKKGVMRISKKAGRMPTLTESSGAEVDVITADELGFSPTYIKADIEGMESAMLRGAERTLREHKPKLNIAAYHRTEDFFSLILQLNRINPGYRIYLRKHPYIPCWDMNIYAV